MEGKDISSSSFKIHPKQRIKERKAYIPFWRDGGTFMTPETDSGWSNDKLLITEEEGEPVSGVDVRACVRVSTQKSLQDLRALGTVKGKGKGKAGSREPRIVGKFG